MSLGFGERPDLVGEGQGFDEVRECKDPLEPIDAVTADDPPFGDLGGELPDFLRGCAGRVGPAGLLWVAHTGQHRLEAYTFDGRLVRSWGKSSMAIDGFCGCCNPCHFAILPDGRFVTSEKGLARVKVYHPDGSLQGVVAGPEALGAAATGLGCARADSSLTLPATATDGSDRVWVLHAETGRLTVFAPISSPAQESDHGATA